MSDRYVVTEELAGIRLDTVVAELKNISRSAAAAKITAGLVKVGGHKAQKSLLVEAGCRITIKTEPLVEKVSHTIAQLEIDVIYDDDDFLVVNKPAEVAAHPSVGWNGPDVVTWLAAAGYRIATSGPEERAGIVHRLDVGTSGLMAVAKSERAYSILKQYFRDRKVTKVYHALIQGMPDPLTGTIDAPIGRHPHHDWKFAILDGGRHARTHYELLEAFGRASLMEVHLETGRTHQIRVHFAAMNHPCVGDPLYGSNPKIAQELGLTRQWLHAYTLGFVHPTKGDYVEFTSDYPQELQQSLEILRA